MLLGGIYIEGTGGTSTAAAASLGSAIVLHDTTQVTNGTVRFGNNCSKSCELGVASFLASFVGHVTMRTSFEDGHLLLK